MTTARVWSRSLAGRRWEVGAHAEDGWGHGRPEYRLGSSALEGLLQGVEEQVEAELVLTGVVVAGPQDMLDG